MRAQSSAPQARLRAGLPNVHALVQFAMAHKTWLLFLAAGMAPITSLSAAFFGWAPLYVTFRFLTLPATFAVIVLGARIPNLGRRALIGIISGMIATAIYDMARFGFIKAGLWGDFIPVIGKLALDDPHASPLWGYGYRFLYDGGFMGMTFAMVFAMLPYKATPRLGIIFGVAVCFCLFGTLVFAPNAQKIAFALTPITATGALVGHVIYGTVLGGLVGRWITPINERRPALFAVGSGRQAALAEEA